ncbi:MAG TPA: hypothetical protein PLD62_03005 [Candidatus Cloacimonadota bacterium]|nr:hypothetical protein [Candidatus Cloacimonadota bacterium]
MIEATIKSILRPDVFRIECDSDENNKILFDRRILYTLKSSIDKKMILDKIHSLIQNKKVEIMHAENLPNGLISGRIYLEGKHLSFYLK